MISKIKITERLHQGFKDWRASKYVFNQYFGHTQWIYSSKKGKISLVHIKVGIENDSPFVFEIYSLEGNLFDDVERFSTKELAEKAIQDYLD